MPIMNQINTEINKKLNNLLNNQHILFSYEKALEILLSTKIFSENIACEEIEVKIGEQIYHFNNLESINQENQAIKDFLAQNISCISTDTRKTSDEVFQQQFKQFTNIENFEEIKNLNKQVLLVALRGERFDAHQHLQNAYTQGYCYVLVEEWVEDTDPNIIQIKVKNTLEALQILAKGYREILQNAHLSITAVVGSNGKTTTKEMLAHVYRQHFTDVFATTGNLNNHIGVPLSILRMRAYHQAAVLEIGMNHIGETSLLAELAQPDITIITNAQREHQEFMQTVENVAHEHALMIPYTNQCLIVPNQTEFLKIWQDAYEKQVEKQVEENIENIKLNRLEMQVFNFINDNNNLNNKIISGKISSKSSLNLNKFIEFNENNENNSENNLKKSLMQKLAAFYNLEVELQQKSEVKKYQLPLKLLGKHNANNAISVLHACSVLGMSAETIAKGFASFTGFNGRLQVVQATPWVIDDTYNANPDSVLAAIDALADFKNYLNSENNIKNLKMCLVLGDMGEVGEEGGNYHQQIGEAALNIFDGLITIGELSNHSSKAWNENINNIDNKLKNQALHFTNHAAANFYLQENLNKYDIYLIKGSRFMKMEQIIPNLIPSLAPEKIKV